MPDEGTQSVPVRQQRRDISRGEGAEHLASGWKDHYWDPLGEASGEVATFAETREPRFGVT